MHPAVSGLITGLVTGLGIGAVATAIEYAEGLIPFLRGRSSSAFGYLSRIGAASVNAARAS
jgi:hypothetical protein